MWHPRQVSQETHIQAKGVIDLLLASPTLGDGLKSRAASWAMSERDPAALAAFAEALRGEREALSAFVRSRLERGLADPAEVSAAAARAWRELARTSEAQDRKGHEGDVESLLESL